jgi:hypothetical protein
MFHRRPSAGWILEPEGAVVHIRLDGPPTVLASYDLFDQLREYLPDAELVLLEGSGWRTSRTWRTARLVNELASAHGVTVRDESFALKESRLR